MTLPSLTGAELATMDLLWEREELTARELREQLYPDAERPQHGTVQRLLQSLEAKGFVSRDRSAGAHRFRARVAREAYAGAQLEILAERLTGGSITPLVAHLVDTRRISPAELDSLRALLRPRDEDEA